MTELAILGMSLPYDTLLPASEPACRCARSTNGSSRLLPLLSTIEDRIALLHRMGPLRPELENLLPTWRLGSRSRAAASAAGPQVAARLCAAMPETGPQ